MMPADEQLLARSADELATTARQLSEIAIEINAASKALATDPEAMRLQAISLQSESMRVALAALAARAVSERLATLSAVKVEVPA